MLKQKTAFGKQYGRRFGEELEKKDKHREEMQRAMLEHLETTKEKKQLREQHFKFLRKQEERAIARQAQIDARQAQIEKRALARQAQEDARIAQEEHIRQQHAIINAMNILEMKTTGLEDAEDIELIQEMKRKARADHRRLR